MARLCELGTDVVLNVDVFLNWLSRAFTLSYFIDYILKIKTSSKVMCIERNANV